MKDARDTDTDAFADLGRPHVLGVEEVLFDPGQSSDHLGQVGHLCDSLHELHLIQWSNINHQRIQADGEPRGTHEEPSTYLLDPTKDLLQVSCRSQVAACAGHGVHVTGVGDPVGQLLRGHHHQHSESLLIFEAGARRQDVRHETASSEDTPV